MYDLLLFLKEIENDYSRTIFNFHLINCLRVGDIYGRMKQSIISTNVFADIVTNEEIRPSIKKLVYCDINLTKHLINQEAYPEYDTSSDLYQSKFSQYFDINAENDEVSRRTVMIFERDKSSLVSYIKTTNKKRKIDYGEIKKTVHNSVGSSTNYFSGKKSDDYLITTIKPVLSQPWIKTISKRMKVDITQNSIVTRGKSSILQTIEIVFSNRTCIKIFKDSTMHIILSKDKSEKGCDRMIDKLFGVYVIMFSLLECISDEEQFKTCVEYSRKILLLRNFKDKVELIRSVSREYGVVNFRIGMFNLTFNHEIDHTVFPSLLKEGSKLKFFKGKKLNIVALRSLQDCRYQVDVAETMIRTMRQRSDVLDKLNIESVCVEKLKELLV